MDGLELVQGGVAQSSGLLHAGSSSAQVADRIRDSIYRSEFVPDEPLREILLARAFAVSRRTIREALLLLDRQGLVRHERNRGARVRRMTPEDVTDLYRVRRALEVQGVRASPSASGSARACLDTSFSELKHQAELGDSHEIIRADLAFHAAVVGLNDSPRINGFFEQISYEMRMAIAILRDDETRLGDAAADVVADHRAIYEYLVQGDVLEAQLAVLRHIEFNERRLMRLVER